MNIIGNSLKVQWLGLPVSTAGGMCSISGWEATGKPHVTAKLKKIIIITF